MGGHMFLIVFAVIGIIICCVACLSLRSLVLQSKLKMNKTMNPFKRNRILINCKEDGNYEALRTIAENKMLSDTRPKLSISTNDEESNHRSPAFCMEEESQKRNMMNGYCHQC